MKKGLETMETRENYLPGQLYLSFGGSDGPNREPISLIESDLIAQNLLILAYDTPVTISDLSKAISIPAAYIEPIVKKLVDGELMVQTDSGKVYKAIFKNDESLILIRKGDKISVKCLPTDIENIYTIASWEKVN